MAEMRAMDRHRASCAACSRHDTMIRRSLILIRNLPPIDVSPDFMARLNRRLEQGGPEARVDVVAPRPYYPSLGAFAALAAGLVAVGYIAAQSNDQRIPAAERQIIAASAPSVTALEPAPVIANEAFVASVPTGMPVWSAVMMAGQAPMHFANLEFRESGLER
jgi:hypothetical protein